jgi:hypothetical protein
MSDSNKFPKGAFFNLPHEKAPDFVYGELNIVNKAEFIEWLKQQNGSQVKISLKRSRNGKGYAELNTYEKPAQGGNAEPVQQSTPVPSNFDELEDDLPF